MLSLVKTIGNILWFCIAGLWLSIGYAFAAVIMILLVVTAPFGIASWRLATYVIWPFGAFRRQSARSRRCQHDRQYLVVRPCRALDCHRTRHHRRAPVLHNHRHPLPVSYTHLRAHETRHDLVC